MSKLLLLIFIMVPFSQSLAADTCNTPQLQKELVSYFQINRRPAKWEAVDHVNTCLEYPGQSIKVQAGWTVQTSTISIGNKTYTLQGLDICDAKKDLGGKPGVLLKHPEGEIFVQRKGRGAERSVIKLKGKNNFLLLYYLKPEAIVKNCTDYPDNN